MLKKTGRAIRSGTPTRSVSRWLTPITFAITLVFSIFAGNLVGNNVYTIVTAARDRLASINIIILLIIILVILLAIIIYLLFRIFALIRVRNTVNNLLELDDSLLRLLASWIPARLYEKELKLLLKELLRDARRELGEHTERACILIPFHEESLHIWVGDGMSEESIEQVRFYVGKDESRIKQRGVAGKAFVDRNIVVTHIVYDKKNWRSDNDSFISFPHSKQPPLYKSFVCVPVIGPSLERSNPDDIISIGVVCFDSTYPKAFDPHETRTVLRIFARRIAAALLIYRKLI